MESRLLVALLVHPLPSLLSLPFESERNGRKPKANSKMIRISTRRERRYNSISHTTISSYDQTKLQSPTASAQPAKSSLFATLNSPSSSDSLGMCNPNPAPPTDVSYVTNPSPARAIFNSANDASEKSVERVRMSNGRRRGRERRTVRNNSHGTSTTSRTSQFRMQRPGLTRRE